MNAKKCDRCKKFYLESDDSLERPSYAGVRIYSVELKSNGGNYIKGYDLCTDCAKKLYSFLKGSDTEKALDEITYEGKTIKEWIEIIVRPRSSQDCIDREATIKRLRKAADYMNEKEIGLGSPYAIAAKFIQDNKDEFPPVTPEPFINKPCISEGVCHEDKMQVLDKLRAEIENHCGFAKENHCEYCYNCPNLMGVKEILEVIDKYRSESEDDANELKEN